MSDRQTPKFKRILLKLSGEALAGDEKFGISAKALDWIANEIVEVHNLKVEIAIVVGGGNIFRGVSATYQGMDRATADYIGMLATTINSLALQNTLETRGLFTRVLSAIEMQQLAETYIRRRATRHLEKGRIVILAAGTGNPYFTTDTASALRAMEIGAEVILKATKVDGVFDADPIENPKAKMFRELTYLDVLQKKLKVMDSTAISLCMDHDLPILVFNLLKKGNIKKAVLGHGVGTLVKKGS